MTVQKIIDSICLVLSEHFPDTEIYTEKVEQGLSEPCFFVLPIMVSDTRQVGRRWHARYTVGVQFLPSSDRPKATCAETEELLYKLLEFITVDGKTVRGENFNSQTIDEVLSFFADYIMFTLEIPANPDEPMAEYTQNYQVKG